MSDAKIAKVMREFYEGKLRSSSGEIVKTVKQAKAIAMSESRKAARKKNPVKKTVANKSAYVNRPSQATRKAPTRRLKARRTKNLAAPAGYFPNPAPRASKPELHERMRYAVEGAAKNGEYIPVAYTSAERYAKVIGQCLADSTGLTFRIRKL